MGTIDLDESFFVRQGLEEGASQLLPVIGLDQPDVLVSDIKTNMKYVVGGALECGR